MARKQARLYCSIWDDMEFISLPQGAQRLYIFLMSQAPISLLGVLPLQPEKWARRASDTTKDSIIDDLKNLEDRRFVVCDWEEQECIVRRFVHYDGVVNSPKTRTIALESFSLVTSVLLRIVAIVELARAEVERLGAGAKDDGTIDFLRALYGALLPTLSTAISDRVYGGITDTLDGMLSMATGTLNLEPVTSNLEPVTSNQGVSHTLSALPTLPSRRAHFKQLPSDFVVTDAMKSWWLVQEGHERVNMKRETDRFMDHWRSNGEPKKDWESTWRNWMRRSIDYSQSRGSTRRSAESFKEQAIRDIQKEAAARGLT